MKRVLWAGSLIALFCTTLLAAQAFAQAPREVAAHVEPLALGIRATFPAGGRCRVGAQVLAGPAVAVTLREATTSDIEAWGGAYAAVTCAVAPRISLALAPIGVAVVAGNDFGAVYPAGQAGLELRRRRLIVGSDVRVIRIAGTNGSGLYRTLWIPVRVGWVLGRTAP